MKLQEIKCMEGTMTKYIDSEKLKAKVKELNLATKTYEEQVTFNNALAMVVEIINSLQQEQPKLPKKEIAEYYYHKGVYEGLSQGRADAQKILEEYMKRQANPVIVIKQQEQPKLYKDESLGSPDYERGFKHGRDYQTSVNRKYTNKDKVIAYLVDKGYPVSTNGEIPTYQEIFDMINNAIKHANKQEQPDVDLEAVLSGFFGYYAHENSGEYPSAIDIARHFYELGKARKEE